MSLTLYLCVLNPFVGELFLNPLQEKLVSRVEKGSKNTSEVRGMLTLQPCALSHMTQLGRTLQKSAVRRL